MLKFKHNPPLPKGHDLFTAIVLRPFHAITFQQLLRALHCRSHKLLCRMVGIRNELSVQIVPNFIIFYHVCCTVGICLSQQYTFVLSNASLNLRANCVNPLAAHEKNKVIWWNSALTGVLDKRHWEGEIVPVPSPSHGLFYNVNAQGGGGDATPSRAFENQGS